VQELEETVKEIKKGGHRLFESDPQTSQIVSDMLLDLERNGMDAVRKYSARFDEWNPSSFELTVRQIREASESLSPQLVDDTAYCQGNVRAFAEAQLATIEPLEVESPAAVIRCLARRR
jgi:sulfopropanediol 3-dehydrogenase